MSNHELTADEIVDAIHAYAASELEKGVPHVDVRGVLVERGLDQETAARVILNLREAQSSFVRALGRQNMMHGAIWCFGGIAATVASRAAATGGGLYIVAWGAIVLGGIQFFRGVLQCNS